MNASRSVTFMLPAGVPALLIAHFDALGLSFGPASAVERTVLDTFDGRLHRAGGRCELRSTGRSKPSELWLLERDGGAARTIVAGPVRFAEQLEVGPLRSRLERLTARRALVAAMRVAERVSVAELVNRDDKVVATVSLHRRIRVTVDGSDGTAVRSDVLVAGDVLELACPTGYDKALQPVLHAVRAWSSDSVDGDAIEAIASAAGIEFGGFDTSPGVPLDPGMAAMVGVRRVLVGLLATIDATWTGTLERVDVEFLHDFRIAVRRSRTVLGECRSLLPDDVAAASLRLFSELGRATGPARDLDVMLLEWSSYLGPMEVRDRNSLAPVRELLVSCRDEAYEALAAVLRAPETVARLETWRTWLDGPAPGEDDSESIGPAVATLIKKAQRRVIRHGRLITLESPAEQLHDLRKDAKRLRYLLECFAGLLPAKPLKRYVAGLKALKENLGEYQDTEVHADDLRRLARDVEPGEGSTETLMALGQLTARLDQRQAAARTEFSDRFADFDTDRTHRALRELLEPLHR